MKLSTRLLQGYFQKCPWAITVIIMMWWRGSWVCGWTKAFIRAFHILDTSLTQSIIVIIDIRQGNGKVNRPYIEKQWAQCLAKKFNSHAVAVTVVKQTSGDSVSLEHCVTVQLIKKSNKEIIIGPGIVLIQLVFMHCCRWTDINKQPVLRGEKFFGEFKDWMKKRERFKRYQSQK